MKPATSALALLSATDTARLDGLLATLAAAVPRGLPAGRFDGDGNFTAKLNFPQLALAAVARRLAEHAAGRAIAEAKGETIEAEIAREIARHGLAPTGRGLQTRHGRPLQGMYQPRSIS